MANRRATNGQFGADGTVPLDGVDIPARRFVAATSNSAMLTVPATSIAKPTSQTVAFSRWRDPHRAVGDRADHGPTRSAGRRHEA